MQFGRDFFDLNLRFARKVSEVTGRSLQDSLLKYTHLYLAFRLERDFNPENPVWQEYLYQISNRADQIEYTYRFYREQIAQRPKPEPEHPFGCFSYTLWDDHHIRLHFRNATNEPGVLQKHRVPERISELTEMFQTLKKVVPHASVVIGGSWLYNIEAYRRLFPAKYLDTAWIGLDDYQFIALWGQFLLSDGSIRPRMAEVFLKRIEKQSTPEGLRFCFPYQVLRVQCSIEEFCDYYRIRE